MNVLLKYAKSLGIFPFLNRKILKFINNNNYLKKTKKN